MVAAMRQRAAGVFQHHVQIGDGASIKLFHGGLPPHRSLRDGTLNLAPIAINGLLVSGG
jgi:hypothetical protein